MRRLALVVIAVFLAGIGLAYAQGQQPPHASSGAQQDLGKKQGTVPPASFAADRDKLGIPTVGRNTETQSPAAPSHSGPAQSISDKKDGSDDWSKLWIAVIQGFVTISGAVAVILFQRHSLEESLKAQKENLDTTIQAQLKTSTDKLQEEERVRKEEHERRRSALIMQIGAQSAFIRVRVKTYAQQVLDKDDYNNVTRGQIERLRIDAGQALTVGWENAHLLEDAKIQSQVKIFLELIRRANQRLDDLELRKGDQANLLYDQCEGDLKYLSLTYKQCADEAKALLKSLKSHFKNYSEQLDNAENHANYSDMMGVAVSHVRRDRSPQSSP